MVENKEVLFQKFEPKPLLPSVEKPTIKVKWFRFPNDPSANLARAVKEPGAFCIYGGTGKGKSALAENLGNNCRTVIDLWGCYDEATEVFTKSGWKFFKDLTFQDEITALNKNRIEFHKPTAIQCYDYDGQMIHFGGRKGSKYDLLVTPNNNMYVKLTTIRPYPNMGYIFVEAQTIFDYAKEHSGHLPYYLLIDSEHECRINRHELALERYKGKVYDVTVPNHTLFVRRNGKTAWSGNSRDDEALCWCRSPRKNSILFLKGETVDISSEWPSKNAKDITLKDIDKYEAIISCADFYSTLHEEFEGLTKFMDMIWHRSGWKNAWSVIIREAANLLFARQSLGDNQAVAKSHITYVVREARHVGIALAFDSVRWYSLDIDIRSIAKYTFIKAQGIDGLPDSLHFLYQYFDPYGVMRMGPEKFIIISRDGPLGTGTFTMPSWHKLEHENLMEMLNIQVQTIGTPSLPDGKPATVTDFEHKNIMAERMSTDPITKKHPGQIKIGKKLNRSSATISLHIKYHNNTILKDGECDKCRRSKCEHSKTLMPTV